VNVGIFFYKFGQSGDTLTLDKTYMQTKKDRRKYLPFTFGGVVKEDGVHK
jgi:hypothetical protein